MRIVAAVLLIVACDRRPAVTSCDDPLGGVWIAPEGRRWMMLDNNASLEAYPLFDDSVFDGAPRVIDLRRADDKLAGEIKRRYMRGAETCDARVPIRITKCKDNAMQVVLADVPAPLGFAPCEWPQAAPSRVEQWTRD